MCVYLRYYIRIYFNYNCIYTIYNNLFQVVYNHNKNIILYTNSVLYFLCYAVIFHKYNIQHFQNTSIIISDIVAIHYFSYYKLYSTECELYNLNSLTKSRCI